jgi:hypothetical protein
MSAMVRMGLGLGITALMTLAVGCGGGSSSGAMTAKSAPSDRGMPAAEPAGAYPSAGYGQAEESTSMAPSPPPPSASPRESRSEAAKPSRAPEPDSRPGLGTEWGETRFSRISTVPFVRADPDSPFATAAMFYNDEEGARAMASSAGFRRTSPGWSSQAGGVVSVGLRDERGGFLSGFATGGKNFIVGEAGRRYSIVVRNNTDSRLEVVLSVDGLDVLDGKAASFSKRGYLVDPRGEVEVDGFRQSTDTVAAFRFGSVRGSYAALKTGDSRNVGVIGVAIFNERGTHPFPWTADEVQRRRDANPFPGQFATPP